jgi:pilus assembly protein CpaB
MRAYHILLTVAGVALFGAGTLIAQAFLRTPVPVAAPPRVAEMPMRAILVAKADLAAGQFLQDADVTWNDRPANTLRPDLYLKGADSTVSLVGAVLLRPLHAGEAIQRGDVVSPRERGFLAAVLPPDKRSISIAVDEVTGDAGLIFPGDHVDVIVTHADAQAETPARQVLGETVLENLRVLAVDQALRGPTEERSADAAAPKETKGVGSTPGPPQQTAPANQPQRRATARTVTLEVTAREAEMLAVAVNLGKLTLALRSLAWTEPSSPARPAAGTTIWAGDVMHALGEMGKAPPTATKEVAASPTGVVLIRGGGAAK